jgi:hypothetical protein
MRRWFLSYNSQDAPLAEALERELRRKDRGAAIFFAKNLRPGAYWMPALAEEIAQATGFVLLVGAGPAVSAASALDRDCRSCFGEKRGTAARRGERWRGGARRIVAAHRTLSRACRDD